MNTGSRLAAYLLGTLTALIGSSHLLLKERFAMAEDAKAEHAGKAPRAPSMPPARDPSIAVAEEYELARRAGTAEALELFIARHGDDHLVEKARADLMRLSR